MRVFEIQNNNMTFNAKLNILGKYFVGKEYHALIKKAEKVGYENDIVELSFSNYKDNSIEFLENKKCNVLDKISSMFKARFIPNGEGAGTELFKENIAGNGYKDFWEQENTVANKYIDRLIEKYPNDRIGVSIIEN